MFLRLRKSTNLQITIEMGNDCLLRIMVQVDPPFDESRKDLCLLRYVESFHGLPVFIILGRLEDRILLTVQYAMP
jgi:hypothetical protein